MLLCLKSSLMQISMVYSRWVLVKSEFMSKLTMKLPESWWTITVTKINKSLTVYLLVVNHSEIGPKNFGNLYVGVCKVGKFSLKGRHPSTHSACTLQEPYVIPSLVSTSFKFLRVSSDMHAVRVRKLFTNFFNKLILTDNAIWEIINIYSRFPKTAFIIYKVLHLF